MRIVDPEEKPGKPVVNVVAVTKEGKRLTVKIDLPEEGRASAPILKQDDLVTRGHDIIRFLVDGTSVWFRGSKISRNNRCPSLPVRLVWRSEGKKRVYSIHDGDDW